MGQAARTGHRDIYRGSLGAAEEDDGPGAVGPRGRQVPQEDASLQQGAWLFSDSGPWEKRCICFGLNGNVLEAQKQNLGCC